MLGVFKRLISLNSEKREGIFFLTIGIGSIFTWGHMFYKDMLNFDFNAPIKTWIFDLLEYSLLSLFPIMVIVFVIILGLGLLGMFDQSRRGKTDDGHE